jgi:hemerythrin-like domain-containing protein
MTLAHNLILRGLNSIYLQADNISQSEDISDFLHYCKAWYLTIHHHHEGEEKYLFPAIAEYTGEKDIMDTNIAQHEVFDEGVEGLNEYLENATPETYDGKLVKSKIEGFAPALQTHLREEIATLLNLEKYGGKNLAKSWAYLHKKVFAEMTNKASCTLHYNTWRAYTNECLELGISFGIWCK